MKREDSRILVLPMVPGVRNWRLNAATLFLVAICSGHRTIMGRSEIATNLALILKRLGWMRAVAFDGRSARAAEVREYAGSAGTAFALQDVRALEERAVLESDVRLAVSKALVQYWVREYGYRGDRHRIVPCTVHSRHLLSREDSRVNREDLGASDDGVLVGYIGSSAEWQSMHLVDRLLCRLFAVNARARAILLTDCDPKDLQVWRDFPSRVRVGWVEPVRVREYMSLLDYGLLLREAAVTNAVSSPTKFAEYLSGGAGVVISPGVGDLSELVAQTGCGHVVADPEDVPDLVPLSPEERARNRELVVAEFTKGAHHDSYQYIVSSLLEASGGRR
jgi:hypothetical protein